MGSSDRKQAMASAWAADVRNGQQLLSKQEPEASGADQHIALVEVGHKKLVACSTAVPKPKAFSRRLLLSIAVTSDYCIEHHNFDTLRCSMQGCGACSEEELRSRLAPYGSIAWCNAVGGGRYLVRFLTKDSVAAASQALDGTSVNGSIMKIAPYCVGHLPGLQPADR